MTGGTDEAYRWAGATFAGCGNAARNAVANQMSGLWLSDYTVHTVPRSSLNGANRPVVSNNSVKEDPADIRGGNAQYGSSACGGGGAGGQAYEQTDGQGGYGGNSLASLVDLVAVVLQVVVQHLVDTEEVVQVVMVDKVDKEVTTMKVAVDLQEHW